MHRTPSYGQLRRLSPDENHLECVTRQENTRTFLVIMKLVPMATELETASARPMYLSSTMARGLGVKDPEGRRPQAGE